MLCGRDTSSELFVYKEKACAWKSKFHIMQCANCKFIYVAPLPLEEDIQNYYDNEQYYTDYTSKRWKRWNVRHHLLRKLELIESYCNKGRLLDIGCADGLFLSLAASRAWDVTGVEISRELSSQAKHNYGITVHRGTLFTADFPGESFDVVALIHSLEHSPEPRSIVREVSRIIKPGGYIYIAVPNLDEKTHKAISFLPLPSRAKHRILKVAGGICPPDHLCTFSRSTLIGLLEENGFQVREYVYINRIRPWFMSSLKVWLTLQALSLINILLRSGLHVEILAEKTVTASVS